MIKSYKAECLPTKELPTICPYVTDHKPTGVKTLVRLFFCEHLVVMHGETDLEAVFRFRFDFINNTTFVN